MVSAEHIIFIIFLEQFRNLNKGVSNTFYARTPLGSKKIFRFKIIAFLSPIGLRPLSYDFVFNGVQIDYQNHVD